MNLKCAAFHDLTIRFLNIPYSRPDRSFRCLSKEEIPLQINFIHLSALDILVRACVINSRTENIARSVRTGLYECIKPFNFLL